MTTIAYHHESRAIAVDSRETEGGLICSDSVDKWVDIDGVRWFTCGCTSAIGDATGQLKNGAIESSSGEFAMMALTSDGGIMVISDNGNGGVLKEESKYNYALGSGRFFALAAMDTGMNAEQAVEYAMTRDCFTGGNVNVYFWED
jgi:20S proteasome alpha/beta subunit